jgi:hypothetical protein
VEVIKVSDDVSIEISKDMHNRTFGMFQYVIWYTLNNHQYRYFGPCSADKAVAIKKAQRMLAKIEKDHSLLSY